jgi:hypothetical protein
MLCDEADIQTHEVQCEIDQAEYRVEYMSRDPPSDLRSAVEQDGSAIVF